LDFGAATMAEVSEWSRISNELDEEQTKQKKREPGQV